MTTPPKHSTRYWIVSTIITLASTALGFFLGALAELLYIVENESEITGIGWIAGIVICIIAAILYIILVESKRNCPIFSAHFILYATLTPASKVCSGGFEDFWSILDFLKIQSYLHLEAYMDTSQPLWPSQKCEIKSKRGHIGSCVHDFAHFIADRCPQNIPSGNLQVNRMEHRRSASHS